MINTRRIDDALDDVFPRVLEAPEFDRLTPEERDYFLLRLATRSLEYVQDKENF